MRKITILTPILVVMMVLILGGCSSGGAGSDGGRATVKWEATGIYDNDPNQLEFSISYAWVSTDGTMATNSAFENQITLPWSFEKELESGDSASMNLTGMEDHSNSITLSLYENGELKESYTISGTVTGGSFHPSAGGIVHVVGQ